jgi:hypothetical protein
VDFRAFTDKLRPRLRSTDVIFFRPDWDTTPVLYYLTTDRYRIAASNSPDVGQKLAACNWVIRFRDEDFPRAMKQPLESYHEAGRVDDYLASAVQYCQP